MRFVQRRTISPSVSGFAADSPAPLSVACGDISPRRGESALVRGSLRRHKLHILCPAASGRAQSFRCAASPHESRFQRSFAWLPFLPPSDEGGGKSATFDGGRDRISDLFVFYRYRSSASLALSQPVRARLMSSATSPVSSATPVVRLCGNSPLCQRSITLRYCARAFFTLSSHER